MNVNTSSKLTRALLYIPGKLYQFAVIVRNALYETGYLKQHSLEGATISVGNITLGGTGKTTLVEYIARYLSAEGYTTSILSRGYARKSKGQRIVSDGEQIFSDHLEAGDEPALLASRLPGVVVIVDEDKRAAGKTAEQRYQCEVHILDDGFQHLKLKRDLNLLVIDATDPFGGGEMVPLGRLREPLYGIHRADAIIVTRADRPFDEEYILNVVRKVCGEDVPVLYFYHSVTGLRDLKTDEIALPQQFYQKKVVAFSALGNPEVFIQDLLHYGMDVVLEHRFPDHHYYTQQEIDAIIQSASRVGAQAIVTTEKDAVKLIGINFAEIPVYSLQIEIESDDEIRLKSLLLRAITKKKREKKR